MTKKETLPAKDKKDSSVLFEPFPELPTALKQHEDFFKLYSRVDAIDADIRAAGSKKAQLKRVTQTSAAHLTCLKQAKRIAMEEEVQDTPNSKTWLKAIVRIAERAKELMGRENVKDYYSHYEKPKILRVLVTTGKHYLQTLRQRVDLYGIMARDEVDLRFALEHWELTLMELSHEPHDEVMTLEVCEQSVAWLKSTLAVAVADGETGA